jgi:hypothetical protein
MNVRPFLTLARPANVLTAVADVWAGLAISGGLQQDLQPRFGWLMLATAGLYAGGVVFNDIFDLPIDKVERPERPLPSGQVSIRQAITWGLLLLFIGNGASFTVSWVSGGITLLITLMALLYDRWAKHHVLLGPLAMGTCRGLNLLLGISAFPEQLSFSWGVSLVPLAYVAAITVISRGEVWGGSRTSLVIAAFLYLGVLGVIGWLGLEKNWTVIPLLLLLAGIIFPPLVKAFQKPIGPNMGKAVKAGVLALIVMDAAWVAAFGAWPFVLLVLFLLPLSLYMAKAFAIT